jgi:DNA-binding MarR family transcriptional regulator
MASPDRLAAGGAGEGSRQARVSGLTDHLGYWLRFVSNHVSRAFQTKVEAMGVTVSEWVVLRQLYDGGRVSPGELMDALGMTQGAISKLISRLQSRELVIRSVAEEDRRRQWIVLTDEGRRLVPVLAGLADGNDQEFFGALPAEVRDQILAAMKEIVRLREMKEIPID